MINNGLLYFETRIIVPKCLRKYVINKLHETYFGIIKTGAKAKKLFYFPGIHNHIGNYITLSCPICLIFALNVIIFFFHTLYKLVLLQ